MLNEAHLSKLTLRREEHTLNLMFDLSFDPEYVKTSRSTVTTRSQNKRLLKVKRPKTEKFKKSLAYKGPTKWNALPVDYHNLVTKTLFKQRVKMRFAKRTQTETKSKNDVL